MTLKNELERRLSEALIRQDRYKAKLELVESEISEFTAVLKKLR